MDRKNKTLYEFNVFQFTEKEWNHVGFYYASDEWDAVEDAQDDNLPESLFWKNVRAIKGRPCDYIVDDNGELSCRPDLIKFWS